MTARLSELGGEEFRRADELLDQAAHDVAKYMALTARNVDPTALSQAEAGYLLADLCRTDGVRPAWDLWAPFSGELRALAPADPALETIDREMAELKKRGTTPPADRSDLARLVELTVTVADRITLLRREVRRRRGAGA